jgi:hypothetical protein
MTLTILLLACAAVSFLLSAFGVQSRVNWVSLGYALVVMAVVARVL